MAKGGSDRDCLRTIHNGGTSEGKAGQSLTDRKRVGGRLINCPSFMGEGGSEARKVREYLSGGGVLHSGLCQAYAFPFSPIAKPRGWARVKQAVRC